MAGCAHCGGCCASCGTSCAGFGGGFAGLGLGGWGGGLAPGLDGEDGVHDDNGYGDSGDYHFHPWFGSHRKKVGNDGTTTVDTRALANPNHPDHREAIKSISHIDPEQHSTLMGWLKKELDQAHQ